MTEPLRALIESLREELGQYGEMLARLDTQQQSIVRRAADEVLCGAAAVQEQAAILHAAQARREQDCRSLAASLRAPEDSSLARLIQLVPPDYGPLLQALLEENNQLLARVRQRARQNHLLLRRSLDLMQELLASFCPAGAGSVYGPSGRSRRPTLQPAPLCDAAG